MTNAINYFDEFEIKFKMFKIQTTINYVLCSLFIYIFSFLILKYTKCTTSVILFKYKLNLKISKIVFDIFFIKI